MKVLFDHQAFDMQTHGGVSRCFAELYSHRPASLEAEISVVETDNVYLRELGFPAKGTAYEHFLHSGDSKLKHALFKFFTNARYRNFSRFDRWPQLNRLESVAAMRKQDFDIFHTTFFDDYFLQYIGDKPFVVTVHDMIPELYPEYYPADDAQIVLKKKIIPRASHIIAVSNRTKEDLVRIMNIQDEKVSIIYHGADDEPYIYSGERKFDFQYILYVGERRDYKNFAPFSRDCIPVLKRHPDLNVVCTGMPFTEAEVNFFDAYGVRDRFIHVFVRTKQELSDLYHDAVTFVYPSEYEGFGIPILEAYRAGCPVMLNNASCFPEIAGDAAVYFRMDRQSSDFEEQFETLYHMTGDERRALLKKQNGRLKNFSWTKSAQELADVYSGIV